MRRDFRQRFWKNRMAVAGSVIVFVLFAVSLLAPWLAPYDPNAIDLKNRLPAGEALLQLLVRDEEVQPLSGDVNLDPISFLSPDP